MSYLLGRFSKFYLIVLSSNQLFFARQLNNTHEQFTTRFWRKRTRICLENGSSPIMKNFFCSSGNAGTTNLAMESTDFEAIKAFAKGIGMVVVGPEDPLVKGFMISFKRSALSIFKLWSFKNGCTTRG
jgi:hypothetical protein